MGPRSATKDVSTFSRDEVRHPQKSSSSSPNPPACSLAFSPSPSFTKKVCDIQGYFIFPAAQASKLNFLYAPPSPNIARQLSFICTMRPVFASVKVSLPNGHTVINGIPLASTSVILANAAEAIKEGGSFFYCFFFCNCRLFLKLKFLHLPTFFHFRSVEK